MTRSRFGLLLLLGATVGLASASTLVKTGLADKIPGYAHSKVAHAGPGICTTEAMASDPSLFISCGGFLE